MHAEAMNWVKSCREKFSVSPEDRILEVGSYNHNGTVRDLFSDSNHYLGVDIISGPCVDIVGDINNEEFRESLLWLYNGFDIVVSTETLEHTPWKPLMSSMIKMLDTKSEKLYIVLTCAGDNRPAHSFDGNQRLRPGEWYQNVNKGELLSFVTEELNKKFEETHEFSVVVDSNPGDYDTYLYVEITKCE